MVIKIKQRKIAVVVGGANLDIKGYSNNYIRYSSSPGYIEESPGGVGRNIAEDLALLAKDVYLLTVLADDHNGDFLADITAASGVNLDHIKKIAADKIPSGRYLAHLDQSGDLMGAVADMRILAEIDLDYLKSKIELIAGASILILDTNLKLDAVRYLLNFCEDSSIITLIDAVSVEKSLKLRSQLKKIDYLRANLDEAEIIFSIREINETVKTKNLKGRLKKLNEVYAELDISTVVIISLGAKGCYLLAKKEGKLYHKLFAAEKIAREDIVESTGAGDALTAGIAAALMEEMEVEAAIKLGIRAASITIQSKYSSNPELKKLNTH